MKGDNYSITVAEGGFIVHVNRASNPNAGSIEGNYEPRVFADSSALLNYLHNELAGSE